MVGLHLVRLGNPFDDRLGRDLDDCRQVEPGALWNLEVMRLFYKTPTRKNEGLHQVDIGEWNTVHLVRTSFQDL